MLNWITISERVPYAYRTGSWDGKRSDLVLVFTDKKQIFAAEMYEGVLDGSEFCDFYSQNGEWKYKELLTGRIY
jgi:hypothetical protein